MKKMTVLICCILGSMVSWAGETVIIRGTVAEIDHPEVLVRVGREIIRRAPVQDDASFVLRMDLETEVKEVTVAYGTLNETIFLRPGREIEIRFGRPSPRPRSREDIMDRAGRLPPSPNQVSGSPETDYYRAMLNVIHPGDIRFLAFMPWNVFNRYQEDALEAKMLFSEIFALSHDIPASFIKEVEQTVTYLNYSSFIRWPGMYQTMTGTEPLPDEISACEARLEELYEQIEWNDPDLLSIWHYVQFAIHHLDRQIRETHEQGSFLLDAYEVITNQVSHSEVRDFFLLNYTDRFLAGEIPANQPRVVEAFRGLVSSPDHLDELERIISEIPAFNVQTPAYDFTLKSIEGDKVSLSDFKGQVVYIDFWATWCGPCIREIPYLLELKESLEGRNDIVILGISTDAMRDKDKWRDMVKEKGLGELQLFAGEQAADLRKHYEITGIPHFVIINKDGTIYQNKTIRPSNPQTRHLLLEVASQ